MPTAPLATHEEMDRWKKLPVWAQQELERWRVDEAFQRGRADTMSHALASIGKNTSGREPLAAAYARGVLEELDNQG
jgi:hypothetical protein